MGKVPLSLYIVRMMNGSTSVQHIIYIMRIYSVRAEIVERYKKYRPQNDEYSETLRWRLHMQPHRYNIDIMYDEGAICLFCVQCTYTRLFLSSRLIKSLKNMCKPPVPSAVRLYSILASSYNILFLIPFLSSSRRRRTIIPNL